MAVLAGLAGLFAAAFVAALAVWARTRARLGGCALEVERLRGELERTAADCRRRLEEKDESSRQLLKMKDEACARALAEKNLEIERFLGEKEKSFAAVVRTLQEQFANLAEQKLKASAKDLSDAGGKCLADVVRPFQDQLEKFRAAVEANRVQQVANKASFDQAMADLGDRALKIGRDAENLARALKSESKTQGDWGEMTLANILSAAGLKAGLDFIEQAQETDAAGNRLIPDVEIPLPDHGKLLVDSKCSVTAYLDYVAAEDDAARDKAAREHVASVRRHLDELAAKDYVRKVKGAQGYILMFIPNEGSYLLAMERDRRLATDAFRRHVIIVNPTTLLLCLQIVALLRSREALNENAERISIAAAKMYEKFAGFSDTFTDLGRRLDGLTDAYRKARGQLCDGNANVIRQLEALKDMGVVTARSVNSQLLERSMGK